MSSGRNYFSRRSVPANSQRLARTSFHCDLSCGRRFGTAVGSWENASSFLDFSIGSHLVDCGEDRRLGTVFRTLSETSSRMASGVEPVVQDAAALNMAEI